MLTCEEYLDAVLKYYQSTFDIERPYMLESEECLAYGHFYSHSEKYVLTRSAKMWEANSFEHAFFFQCPVPGAEMVSIRGWCEARTVLVDLASQRVYANAKGKPLVPVFEKVLKKSQTPARV